MLLLIVNKYNLFLFYSFSVATRFQFFEVHVVILYLKFIKIVFIEGIGLFL
jgi:hypothetical protein